MKYLPYIAGAAAFGLASRRGRRKPREGLSYFSASWSANAEEQARAYKTKELFAYMPPEEFLALAEPFSREGESPSKRENVLRLLTENTRFRDGPALSFDETGQVYGHEGRHRATALLRMGVARIPVLLRARGGTGIRWGEQDDPTAWGYNKNLPSWLLSEKPLRDMAAWRQKRVAAPWYTRGPERGQLRPEYRVPSTGRTARRGRRATRKSLIEAAQGICTPGNHLNCKLFAQLLTDTPRLQSLPVTGRERVGDVLQYGSNPARHWAVYIGSDEVLHVPEWGGALEIASWDAVAREHGPPIIRKGRRATQTCTEGRTDPVLWAKVKKEVTAGSKGGKPGQWSARKAQMAVKLYKARGGTYCGPKTEAQKSLTRWTKEDWDSDRQGDRYLPKKAREALTKKEYRKTSAKKRRDTAQGKQFSKQPANIAKKTAKHRGRRAGQGLCFPWALNYITKHPGALLLQGKIREPGSHPPNWYWHAWIIHNGRVKDWQTMEAVGVNTKFQKDGWPVGLWMETFTPSPGSVEEYDREEAWEACEAAGMHAGPWHGPLSVGEKQPFVPSWANLGRRAETYPWLSLAKIKKYEQLMRDRGVSEVARSPRGFLTAYKRAGSKTRLRPEWRMKRDGFVARHWTQAQKQARPLYETKGKYAGTPTRWHLALIAWGFSPDGARGL